MNYLMEFVLTASACSGVCQKIMLRERGLRYAELVEGQQCNDGVYSSEQMNSLFVVCEWKKGAVGKTVGSLCDFAFASAVLLPVFALARLGPRLPIQFSGLMFRRIERLVLVLLVLRPRCSLLLSVRWLRLAFLAFDT